MNRLKPGYITINDIPDIAGSVLAIDLSINKKFVALSASQHIDVTKPFVVSYTEWNGSHSYKHCLYIQFILVKGFFGANDVAIEVCSSYHDGSESEILLGNGAFDSASIYLNQAGSINQDFSFEYDVGVDKITDISIAIPISDIKMYSLSIEL